MICIFTKPLLSLKKKGLDGWLMGLAYTHTCTHAHTHAHIHTHLHTTTQVLESDRCGLLDDDSLSSDDSDYERPSNLSSEYSPSSKWWFQQPAIRKNWCLVVGIWILVFLGIGNALFNYSHPFELHVATQVHTCNCPSGFFFSGEFSTQGMEDFLSVKSA